MFHAVSRIYTLLTELRDFSLLNVPQLFPKANVAVAALVEAVAAAVVAARIVPSVALVLAAQVVVGVVVVVVVVVVVAEAAIARLRQRWQRKAPFSFSYGGFAGTSRPPSSSKLAGSDEETTALNTQWQSCMMAG